MADFDFAAVPTLETERLILRRIRVDDRADWFAVFNSPGAIDYLIDFEEAPREEVMDEIVEWADRIFALKTGIRWAVTLKPADRMIGSCGFHLFDPRNQRVEFGYELHSDYWRQGIMSEAVGAVLEFCFLRLGLHRVEADVTEGNVASAALLQKAGFALEGVWRERVYWRGGFQTMWQYGMLASEFRSLRSVSSI